MHNQAEATADLIAYKLVVEIVPQLQVTVSLSWVCCCMYLVYE